MTREPERILEENLIAQLVGNGYSQVSITDEKDLLANLKTQLEIHNDVSLSDNDFKQIVAYISKGNIYNHAKILRDRVPYKNDNYESKTIELLNQNEWCKNEFQVTNQITMEGTHKNRYDVTILINGLPLVQIELKRKGIELKEAFNQTNRYQRHSYSAGSGLFLFIQLFVISNGVNTRYYCNNRLEKRSYKQTFSWSDSNNKKISQLSDFADIFLEPCTLAKMIIQYVVLNESQKQLMVLRPYQYYAVEAIVGKVIHSRDYGYIWHTTGSGKTLTSYKAAQRLTTIEKVHKVLFVVDRKDLDYQTTKEFNSFSEGSIDGTDNTRSLVEQLSGDNKLVVTTIQKLNSAISKSRYNKDLKSVKDKRIVIIFDECHRSQFSDTHNRIKHYFKQCQMFGFTGTPIFEENACSNKFGKRTTSMLFGNCLHKYVITDAIRDDNVLRFSVEYIRTFKRINESTADIDVESIDTAEVMEAPQRLENITDYIIQHHNRKTYNRQFTSIFATSSISTLIKYYQLFAEKKQRGEHDLKVATIFSYQENEVDSATEDVNPFDRIDESVADTLALEWGHHSKDVLENCIQDYNKLFGTNYTSRDSQSYYKYYNNIAKRVKERQIDILIVVNMFLTGFDSKPLNTLYVDKNLKHHGLLQAYSRTNRILNDRKSQGNIVCFRNLKTATDDAIALFSNKEAHNTIIMEPYEEYITRFNISYIELLGITPTVNSVDALIDEDAQANFIRSFRKLMRLKNILETYTEFSYDDLSMSEQKFEDFKSKYLDLYEQTRNQRTKEAVSILDEIDFEVELIRRDDITVAYILRLIAELSNAPIAEQNQRRDSIVRLMNNEIQLRSKRDLIEKFIRENVPTIEDSDLIPTEFEKFWGKERMTAMMNISREENINSEKLEEVIGRYLFTNRDPIRTEIISTMNEEPPLEKRISVANRVIEKIHTFVETFVEGVSS